jgi:hypothetical protein
MDGVRLSMTESNALESRQLHLGRFRLSADAVGPRESLGTPVHHPILDSKEARDSAPWSECGDTVDVQKPVELVTRLCNMWRSAEGWMWSLWIGQCEMIGLWFVFAIQWMRRRVPLSLWRPRAQNGPPVRISAGNSWWCRGRVCPAGIRRPIPTQRGRRR